jgi:hypothetical protein
MSTVSISKVVAFAVVFTAAAIVNRPIGASIQRGEGKEAPDSTFSYWNTFARHYNNRTFEFAPAALCGGGYWYIKAWYGDVIVLQPALPPGSDCFVGVRTIKSMRSLAPGGDTTGVIRISFDRTLAKRSARTTHRPNRSVRLPRTSTIA